MHWINICRLILFICMSSSFEKVSAEDSCVWYGECKTLESGLKLNCEYNGPPKPFDPSAIDQLKAICPELVDSNGKALTCCDSNQLRTLTDSIGIPQTILARCPSCWYNLRSYFCSLSCGTQQSRYMYVQNTTDGDEKHKGQKAITAVEVMVIENYVEKFFDSCKDVLNLILGGKAMDFLCGPWGSVSCTGDRWLTYMGDTDNGFTPFLLNVTYWVDPVIREHDKSFEPLNLVTPKCNEKINNETACNCSDCPASCPAISPSLQRTTPPYSQPTTPPYPQPTTKSIRDMWLQWSYKKTEVQVEVKTELRQQP